MSWRIRVEQLTPSRDGKTYEEWITIYEQKVERIFLSKIIYAVNFDPLLVTESNITAEDIKEGA